jgi:hypothetical protein
MAIVKPITEQEISKRLQHCIKDRAQEEKRWDEIDAIIYGGIGGNRASITSSSQGGTVVGINSSAPDEGDSDISLTYAFKNLRFIHAQMSSNPPTVSPRPTSSDSEDLRRADAADRLVRYSLRKYLLQEVFDQGTLNTLQYGTGVYKTIFSSEIGDIISFNQQTGEAVLEGDFDCYALPIRNFYCDPDARSVQKVNYAFEKHQLHYNEAVFKFGEEKKDILESCRRKNSEVASYGSNAPEQQYYDVVEVFEYYERGLPENGYAGRHGWCTASGKFLTKFGPSPYAFTTPGKKRSGIKKALLPFHILTDIDVPGRVWGRSFLDYVVRPQEVLDRLDSAMLDNLQAHSCYRMIVPEGTELGKDSPTNSPWDVVSITGNQPPYFMGAPSMSPDFSRYREQVKQGIDEMSGVNESMFGQQSREQANAAMQYAVNQGSQIRRRLFNKYAMVVESVYKAFLNICREHWDTKRKISVIGKEKALETVDIDGMDIDGGFDIIVEYGTSLALDPITRRQEILQLQPLFEAAGVPKRTSLRLMKLNELSEMYDELDLAEDRQREYVEKMLLTNTYIPPEPFEDHVNMLLFLKRYVMQREFTILKPEQKNLVRQHLIERTQMDSEEKKLFAPPAPAAPAGMDMGVLLGGGAPASEPAIGGMPSVGQP